MFIFHSLKKIEASSGICFTHGCTMHWSNVRLGTSYALCESLQKVMRHIIMICCCIHCEMNLNFAGDRAVMVHHEVFFSEEWQTVIRFLDANSKGKTGINTGVFKSKEDGLSLLLR